jgi:hypothetical protein
MANALIGALMPYFVIYVVQPEFQVLLRPTATPPSLSLALGCSRAVT